MYDMLQMLPKIVNMTIAASFAGCVVLLLRAVLRKVPAGYFMRCGSWYSCVSCVPSHGNPR